MKCLTCDLGGSSIKYALVDENAVITESGKLPAPLDSTQQFVDIMGELYDKFQGDICGITISMPGYINPENGYLYESGAYMKLYNHSIIDLLKDRCPVDIVVENDGKCGAMAEAWMGALSDCNDGVVIILGSGIAGGVIKDKKIHRGKGFTAGEFSYLLTNTKYHDFRAISTMDVGMIGITYKLCKAKNLDLSVQGAAPTLILLEDLIGSSYEKKEEIPNKIKANGVQLFKWLDEGDADAIKIYDEFIHALGTIVFNIQCSIAPEKIVIGGGLSCQNRIFPDLEAELSKYYDGIGIGMPQQMRSVIVRSKYLDECNMIGARYNFLTRFGK